MVLSSSAFVCHLSYLHLLTDTRSWEYPAKQAIGFNIVSSNDSSNLLQFLKTLRAMKGAENLLLSAAPFKPYIDSKGSPLSDVTAFAKVLDYIGSPNLRRLSI
jgi:chitinase